MGLSKKTTVEPRWLLKHIGDEALITVDCRYNLMDSSEGRKKYLSGHLPGAYFLDMEADLTGTKQEHGGRHPIPQPADFAESMSKIGVQEGKTVVAYDDDLSGASRFWWLLNYFGHNDVYVLNGGISGWFDEGGKITADLPREGAGKFEPVINRDLLFDVNLVREYGGKNVIVDSRAPERYHGETEPIDFKAGHIPGAVNVFYKDTMEPQGRLKGRDELRKMYSRTGPSPVVYCGSGITSCVNVLGMAVIGIEAKLYSGSWSDWISYPENEVETSER